MFLLTSAALLIGASLSAAVPTGPIVDVGAFAFADGSGALSPPLQLGLAGPRRAPAGEASPTRSRSERQSPSPTQAMPDGPGRSLVIAQCVGCHALDMTLGKRGTAAEWRGTVQTMVDRGAKITSPDAEAIATYLGQHYGPGVPSAASVGPSGQGSALPDGPGRDVLTQKCF